MQQAIRVFEENAKQASCSLDEIEARASSEFPAAAPILKLCQRLREAKIRYQILFENISKIQEANENLQKCIANDLMPTAKQVKAACAQEGVQVPSIIPEQVTKQAILKAATPAPTPSTTTQTAAATATTTSKSKLPHPRKSRKSEPAKPQHEYIEITDDEFNAIPDYLRRSVKIDELRQVHQFIFNFFYGSSREEESMPRKEFLNIENSAIKRKIESVLKCLKYIKKIQMDRSNNVIQCV